MGTALLYGQTGGEAGEKIVSGKVTAAQLLSNNSLTVTGLGFMPKSILYYYVGTGNSSAIVLTASFNESGAVISRSGVGLRNSGSAYTFNPTVTVTGDGFSITTPSVEASGNYKMYTGENWIAFG